jgi:predicted lipid-binding transport protein (Tim44 family)
MPLVLAGLVLAEVPQLEWVVVGGLAVFGIAFAVNSSVHSYLILAYAGSEKAAEDVGFYYAANALGRFLGTLMSGLLYQWGGLSWSLLGSGAMLVACWLVTLALPLAVPAAAGAASPELDDAAGRAASGAAGGAAGGAASAGTPADRPVPVRR